MKKRVLDVGQCDYDHGNLSSVLGSFGVEVRRARTAADAWTALRSERFDLVLINRIFDQDGGEGLTLIREIRSDDSLSETPVMLVSNYQDAQQEAARLGAQPGFGKAALQDSATRELLKRYL